MYVWYVQVSLPGVEKCQAEARCRLRARSDQEIILKSASLLHLNFHIKALERSRAADNFPPAQSLHLNGFPCPRNAASLHGAPDKCLKHTRLWVCGNRRTSEQEIKCRLCAANLDKHCRRYIAKKRVHTQVHYVEFCCKSSIYYKKKNPFYTTFLTTMTVVNNFVEIPSDWKRTQTLEANHEPSKYIRADV